MTVGGSVEMTDVNLVEMTDIRSVVIDFVA
jgi:hypothetical protein